MENMLVKYSKLTLLELICRCKIIIMIESLVSFTIEKLRDPLIIEAKVLYGVSDQIKTLQVKLKKMKCFLRDADRKQE